MKTNIANLSEPRLNYREVSPTVLQALWGVQKAVNESGLEHSLQELVKLRASQLNGCAFCIDMHYRDALKAGETEQRLFLLNAWEEAPVYTPRERAALRWTEALTKLAGRSNLPARLLTWKTR
jgi:AhpD family alkylhydroperoxidase